MSIGPLDTRRDHGGFTYQIENATGPFKLVPGGSAFTRRNPWGRQIVETVAGDKLAIFRQVVSLAFLKKTGPIMKWLGGLLFPKQAPWQQRASMVKLLWAMAIGVITGAFIVAFMFFEAKRF